MVSTHYYEDQDNQYRRRFNSRGHSYALEHDRDMSPTQMHSVYIGARSQRLSPQENRDHSNDNDSNSRPRSRIPVACGRCRKRKIRCSGENGNGGPCQNCKTAGVHDCQFNRVQSIDYLLKSDVLPPADDYSGAGARLNCRNAPYGPQAYGPHNSLPIDNCAYRNHSIPAPYQYSLRSAYAPSYGASYAQDSLEYDVDSSAYALLPLDNFSMQPISNYTTSNVRGWTPAQPTPNYSTPSVRGWTPTVAPAPAQQNSKDPMYLEHSSAVYNPLAPLVYPTNEYHRLSVSGEQKQPLTGLPPQLPVPLPRAPTTSVVDRVLPYPAAVRPAPITSFLRSNDGFPYSALTGLGLSTNHDYAYNRTVKSNDGSSISDSGVSDASASLLTSYIPPSNASTESLSSQQIPYSSQTLTLEHQNVDNYAPRNSQHQQSYEQELPTSSYRYSIGRTQPEIQAEEAPTAQAQEEQLQQQHIPILTSAAGSLSNGQQYVPPMSAVYPAPPVYMSNSSHSQQAPPVNNITSHAAIHHSPHLRRFSSPRRDSIAAA